MGAAAEGVTFGGDTERSRGVSTGEDVGPPSLAELEMRLTPGCSIPRVVRRDDFPIAISGTIGLTGAEIIVDAAVFAAVGLTEAEIIVDAAVCAAVGLTEAEIIVDAAVCAGSTVLSTDFFALVVFAETRGSVSVAGAFTLLDSSESTIEAHGAIQVDDDNVGAEVVSSTSLLWDERGFPIKLLGVALSPSPTPTLKSKVAALADSPLAPMLCMLYIFPVIRK
jgi:hypothetical protein